MAPSLAGICCRASAGGFGSYQSRIDQKMDSMIVMETNEANESCWLSFPISVTKSKQPLAFLLVI